MHLELGTQRLLDLRRANDEKATSVADAGNHGPSVEDDLELRLGGDYENWVGGSKTGDASQTVGEFPKRSQQSTERSHSLITFRDTWRLNGGEAY